MVFVALLFGLNSVSGKGLKCRGFIALRFYVSARPLPVDFLTESELLV